MASREHIAAFVKMVEAGQYIEAMAAFYPDDCSAQARCLAPPVVDGDTVVLPWVYVFPPLNGASPRFEELALQTWRGDKLASERFFYDPRQMRPG